MIIVALFLPPLIVLARSGQCQTLRIVAATATGVAVALAEPPFGAPVADHPSARRDSCWPAFDQLAGGSDPVLIGERRRGSNGESDDGLDQAFSE